MNPIYTDMGFPADLARMAPPDPNVGVPWLLLAQAIGKLPDNLRTDGPMTFYNSLVRYEGIEHRVEDYDSTLQCVFLTAPGVCRWIPLSDQGLEWIGAIKHDEKPQLRPLETHNIIPMPPMILKSTAVPDDILQRIRNGENMRMEQLAGNWSFHNDSDAAMWLSVLRLCNKSDPSVRFEPEIPQPPSTTQQRVQVRKNEIKDRISMYTIMERNPHITLTTVLNTTAEEFESMMSGLVYEEMFRYLRNEYLNAKDIMRNRHIDWKNACVAPLHLLSIEPHDESNLRVRIALTEWTFKKSPNDISRGVVPFYLTFIFKHLFDMQLTTDQIANVDVPSHLFPGQRETFRFMDHVEKRGTYPGWWTRQESNGFVWSYSLWGACVEGLPPRRTGGILYSPTGSGKTVLMTLLCAHRNLSTVIIVPRKKRIQHWVSHFARFAPHIKVHALESRSTQWDELADVVVTTWTTYRRHDECAGPWSRLVIDDAQLIKTKREKYHFLTSIDARYVWLCTNTPSISGNFRGLLHVKTNILDKFIQSPPCDISQQLSPVEIHTQTFNDNDLLMHAFDVVNPYKKMKAKYRRMIRCNPKRAPLYMYAHEYCDPLWKPIRPELVDDPQVQERLREPCPICYETNKPMVYTDCKHVFCKTCIARVAEDTYACPCCRNNVERYTFMADPTMNYCWDRTKGLWSILHTAVVAAYNGAKDHEAELVAYAQTMGEQYLIVGDDTIDHPRSTTFKALEKSGDCYSHIEHLICIGTPTNTELETMKRRISTLADKNVRHIHIFN